MCPVPKRIQIQTLETTLLVPEHSNQRSRDRTSNQKPRQRKVVGIPKVLKPVPSRNLGQRLLMMQWELLSLLQSTRKRQSHYLPKTMSRTRDAVAAAAVLVQETALSTTVTMVLQAFMPLELSSSSALLSINARTNSGNAICPATVSVIEFGVGRMLRS